MRHLPLLMHTYPAISPWNVWDLETEVFELLIMAAKSES